MQRLAATLVLLLASPAIAGLAEDHCRDDIAATRELAATLPADDLSRRVAEHELDTAVLEINSGEVDECPDLIRHARHIIATRPYVLRPGETFGIPPG